MPRWPILGDNAVTRHSCGRYLGEIGHEPSDANTGFLPKAEGKGFRKALLEEAASAHVFGLIEDVELMRVHDNRIQKKRATLFASPFVEEIGKFFLRNLPRRFYLWPCRFRLDDGLRAYWRR